MPTRNINLTDHFAKFVDTSIRSGQYKNASEVVREGLRLLEQRQQEDALRLKRLRDAVNVGEEALARGDYIEVANEELDNVLAGLGREASELVGARRG